MKKILSLLSVLVLLIAVVSCNIVYPVWKLVAEGEFDRAEYIDGGWNQDDKTIVYFKDGGSYVIFYYMNMPSGVQDKHIQIWKFYADSDCDIRVVNKFN